MLVSHFQVFSMMVAVQAFLFLANSPQPSKMGAPRALRLQELGPQEEHPGLGEDNLAELQCKVQLSDGSIGGDAGCTKG